MKLNLRSALPLAALLLFLCPCILLAGAQTHTQNSGTAPAHKSAGSSASFDALSKQADAARDAEKLDDATKLYRKALALKPDWKEGWWSLGTIDYDSNRFAQGMEDFRHLLRLAPNDGTTNLMLGLCEYEVGNYKDSEKHLAAAWKLGIQDAAEMEPLLLYHQVLIQLREQHFEAALDTLSQMLRKGTHNRDVDVACGMGVLRITPDELPAAGTDANLVVQRIGYAQAADSIDTHERARQLYQQAVDASPDFPNIHFAFGRFLMGINESAAAQAEFKEQLKRDPKNYNAMLKLAVLDYHVDSAAGIPYVEQALKYVPNSPFAHYLLGILSLEAGDVDRSVKELEIARKMVPKEPKFAFALSNAYNKANRREDSLREKQAFIQLKAAEKKDDRQSDNDVRENKSLQEGGPQ
jgi:tetratricopeptide (TPR) repeat protein